MAKKPTSGRKFMLLKDLPANPERVFRITLATSLDDYDTVRNLVAEYGTIIEEEVEVV